MQLTHIHTHTTVLLLVWNMSGSTQVSRYQKGKTKKVKTNLDLLEQETVSGSGIWWAICKSALHADNHANIPPLSFLQARCPSWCPTNSVKALKATHAWWICHQISHTGSHWTKPYNEFIDSLCNYECYQIPRLAASSATPQPVAPPPITSMSKCLSRNACSCAARVGNGVADNFCCDSSAITDPAGVFHCQITTKNINHFISNTSYNLFVITRCNNKTTPILWPLFEDNPCKPVPKRQNHSVF